MRSPRGGRTVLFVSHNIPMVSRLCSRMVWMRDGTVHRDGPPGDVIEDYYAFASRAYGREADVDLRAHPNYRANSARVLRRLRILGSDGQPATALPAGGGVTFEIEFDPSAVAFDYVLGIDVCDPSGSPLTQFSTSAQPGLASARRLADASSVASPSCRSCLANTSSTSGLGTRTTGSTP